MPSCSPVGDARLSAATTASWVLEAGPTAGRYYIRDSRCSAASPLYLGFHKTNCSRTVTSLFARTGPTAASADTLWTLRLVSAGLASIENVTVGTSGNTFNVVRVFVRPAAGPGNACCCPLPAVATTDKALLSCSVRGPALSYSPPPGCPKPPSAGSRAHCRGFAAVHVTKGPAGRGPAHL